MWQMLQQFHAGGWARMAQVGYTGAVDRGLWGGMGGSSGVGEEGGRGRG